MYIDVCGLCVYVVLFTNLKHYLTECTLHMRSIECKCADWQELHMQMHYLCLHSNVEQIRISKFSMGVCANNVRGWNRTPKMFNSIAMPMRALNVYYWLNMFHVWYTTYFAPGGGIGPLGSIRDLIINISLIDKSWNVSAFCVNYCVLHISVIWKYNTHSTLVNYNCVSCGRVLQNVMCYVVCSLYVMLDCVSMCSACWRCYLMSS